MSLLKDWGFSAESWRGQKGEYWVVLQGLLIIGFALLPSGSPLTPEPPLRYGIWAIALFLAVAGLVFFIRGLLELGTSLTPLPYPRKDGVLVQTGIYAIVRHPVYTGVVVGAMAWAIAQLSPAHGLGALVLLIFFMAKASHEERLLLAQYPDYDLYQQRVKKLIPWLY
jgi:protein-S-isoprenylcysteine O-methyltransferase Ste14